MRLLLLGWTDLSRSGRYRQPGGEAGGRAGELQRSAGRRGAAAGRVTRAGARRGPADWRQPAGSSAPQASRRRRRRSRSACPGRCVAAPVRRRVHHGNGASARSLGEAARRDRRRRPVESAVGAAWGRRAGERRAGRRPLDEHRDGCRARARAAPAADEEVAARVSVTSAPRARVRRMCAGHLPVRGSQTWSARSRRITSPSRVAASSHVPGTRRELSAVTRPPSVTSRTPVSAGRSRSTPASHTRPSVDDGTMGVSGAEADRPPVERERDGEHGRAAPLEPGEHDVAAGDVQLRPALGDRGQRCGRAGGRSPGRSRSAGWSPRRRRWCPPGARRPRGREPRASAPRRRTPRARRRRERRGPAGGSSPDIRGRRRERSRQCCASPRRRRARAARRRPCR